MRRLSQLAAAAVMAAWTLAGCSNGGKVDAGPVAKALSPLAGKWTGKSEVKGGDLAKFANSVAGGPLTGPSSLTLDSDGTGYMKVADGPERPISWKQEGDRVIIETRGVEGASDKHADSDGPWVGHLSNDRRTMTIDMQKAKVILSQHTGS
jgi:hypothetical protein